MSSKIVITILTISTSLFLVVSIWLAMNMIDLSITNTYLDASVNTENRQMKLTIKLLEKEFVNMNENTLIEKLQTQVNNSDEALVLKKDRNIIIFEHLEFILKDKKVIQIR